MMLSCYGGIGILFYILISYCMSNESTPISIEKSWKDVLKGEFEKEYFGRIRQFLLEEKADGKTIFPKWWDVFNAFDSVAFDQVKVVILWQDPYHGPGQAHGLCFSVQDGIRQPPSLKNIFKELDRDIGFDIPQSGCLQKWTKQWVLLLNAILTVQAHKPASHSDIGWWKFTDSVISLLSQKRKWIVFLLRWKFAQSKKELIDLDKHYILETTHPSPFSAHRGFLGSGHFSKVNEILQKEELSPVDRSL